MRKVFVVSLSLAGLACVWLAISVLLSLDSLYGVLGLVFWVALAQIFDLSASFIERWQPAFTGGVYARIFGAVPH